MKAGTANSRFIKLQALFAWFSFFSAFFLLLFEDSLAASLTPVSMASAGELRKLFERSKRQLPSEYAFEWNYGKWTTCSTTCGHGLMHRPIHCMAAMIFTNTSIDSVGFNWSSIVWQVVPDDHCAELSRPPLNAGQTRVCNRGPCTRLRANIGQAVWLKGHWMPCNASCGGGIQHRPVFCYHRGRHVRDSDCEETESKPRQFKQCSSRPCTSQWVTGPWSTCSNGCGWGIHHRAIICAPIGSTKPPGIRLTVSWGTGCAPEKQPLRSKLCYSRNSCPTTRPPDKVPTTATQGMPQDTDLLFEEDFLLKAES